MEDEIWGLYENMIPSQIEEILEATPIAYLPWGALEYHSYHNPVGLDGIKAYNLCIDLAMELGGLVIPTVYQAANLIKSYPGVDFKKHSIEFSEGLIRLTCQEYFQQLVETGFKVVVCLIGHAGEPHIDILKEVANEYNKKHPDCRFWAFAEFDVLPDDLLVANHSALGETALQLHYAPETVHQDLLPQEREITLVKDGIAGQDPRLASAERGALLAKTVVANASEKIKAMLNSIA